MRPLPVSSPFGPRIHPKSRQHDMHRGIDVPLPVGTPIRAVTNGKIVRVDVDGVGRGERNGNAVHLSNGVATFHYLHLSRVDVEVGQRVRVGERLGLTGNTGSSTGPHLHYAISTGSPLRYLDPVAEHPPKTFAV